MKRFISQLLAIISLFAAVFVLAYTLYEHWDTLSDFVKEHCPCAKREARRAEFADYVD